ncbi:MAG TPA: hypothetical protein DC042_06685 [Bacteroidales bacterium]|nr:hypothetical protein [Bacteroidales bacterium]
MKTPGRYQSLDLIRGIALIFIILFHTSVYNFANIHKIDLSNPPILIVLISFLILWGGLIILYSGFSNTLMVSRRIMEAPGFKPFGMMIVAGFLFIAIHFLLILVLGRWSVDFVNNQPDMTLVATSIRSGSIQFPSLSKLFEGSALSTIGINLIVLSLLTYSLLRNGGIAREFRNYTLLLTGGSVIMILSFIRIDLYPAFQDAIDLGRTGPALAGSFLLANPYPLIPYLAYGFFGSAVAMMIYNHRMKLMGRLVIPMSIIFILYGVTGALNYDKTISTPDFFWYFKTQAELGIFLLLMVTVILGFRNQNRTRSKVPVILWFSRLSLTIYLLETLLSEVLGQGVALIFPDWNQTINGCLLFGALNVLFWAGILAIWRRIDFRYSLEYFWVKMFRRFGKESTKLDEIP